MAPAAARESTIPKRIGWTAFESLREAIESILSWKVVGPLDPSPLREQELEANVAERVVATRTGEPASGARFLYRRRPF